MDPRLATMTACLLAGACASAAEPPSAPWPPSSTRPEGRPRGSAPSDGPRGPIVVELFTSQGCSSCPPADRVLSRLAHEGLVADRPVEALAFHVDYWNDLGWADPWSSEAWSDRQRTYAAAFHDERIYTPQAVIGGREHVIGSNESALRARLAVAPAPAELDARVLWADGHAIVTATAPAGADAWVAIYEDDLATDVRRGENAGRALSNDRVVRRLVRIARAGHEDTAEIPLDSTWHHVGALAFAQRPDRVITASRALGSRTGE